MLFGHVKFNIFFHAPDAFPILRIPFRLRSAYRPPLAPRGLHWSFATWANLLPAIPRFLGHAFRLCHAARRTFPHSSQHPHQNTPIDIGHFFVAFPPILGRSSESVFNTRISMMQSSVGAEKMRIFTE